jgi:hypothetical protein
VNLAVAVRTLVNDAAVLADRGLCVVPGVVVSGRMFDPSAFAM